MGIGLPALYVTFLWIYNKMIAWSESYDIGIKRIDMQHRAFLGLVEEFHTERLNDASLERLLSLLNEIVLYATFHFCSEENVMRELDFQALQQHTQHHISLLDSLTNKMAGLQMGGCSPQEVEDFLTDWFIKHVVQEDSRIPLFAQRNLEKYRVTP
jgi:hemerythrin